MFTMSTELVDYTDFSPDEIIIEETEEICEIDATDRQCGHIFFNKLSLMLKFHCTFCLQTYDNINFFCDHLSEHIYDTKNDDTVHSDNLCDTQAEDIKQENYDNDMTLCEQAENEYNIEHHDPFNNDINIMHGGTMVIEELDEADEIEAEVEEELRVNREIFLKRQNENYHQEVTNSNKIANNMERARSRMEIIRKHPKRKKVTTVKVIAVRNRITELYERIKAEQENIAKDNVETNEINETLENNIKLQQSLPERAVPSITHNLNSEACNADEPAEAPKLQPATKLIQKIIGETVITLIPEGCEMPTAESMECSATNLMNEQQHKISRSDDDCTCPACGKRFRSSFSLAIHKRAHYLESNSNIKLAHKCSDCDCLFNKISELREHVEKVHFPEGFICKICNKKLTSLNLLEIHMRKVHLHRPFRCNHCGQTFENLAAYELHANVPDGCGYNYRCHICGRKYTTDRALQQHMSNHKEQIPQSCVVCGKKTLRITQHMKIHAPRPKRINKCNICGKCFNFSSGLSTHYRIMHRQQRMAQKFKKSLQKGSKNQQLLMNAMRNDERNSDDELSDDDNGSDDDTNIDVNAATTEKEEEAKRVIVEMIQSGEVYTTFISNDNHWTPDIDTAPPIAREETISAVNSIVDNL